ncbi:MAG: hypothetical protein JKY65_14785, partial [Planctomycetes bacterium]|nr:hypothetical protein [Planctomycetota bacterium]
ALGCVAYWLLTGSTVFTREKAIPMILDHIGTAPTPPSERTEQEIPADLEALIMECLAKEPADRPPSALDLAGRLRRIVLPTPWTPERADAWWEAHHHESHGEPSPETQTHDPGVVQDPALAPTILMGSPE